MISSKPQSRSLQLRDSKLSSMAAMRTFVLVLCLLTGSTIAFRRSSQPLPLTSLSKPNITHFLELLRNVTDTNATATSFLKTHQVGDWPVSPFRVSVGSHLVLRIELYGRKAPIPRFSPLMLDSLDNIIYQLDSAGRPSDLLGPAQFVSYNGLVRVKFGSNGPEDPKLTRLDASEVLSNVWDLTAKYGSREIGFAEIEDSRDGEMLALFVMRFPETRRVANVARV